MTKKLSDSLSVDANGIRVRDPSENVNALALSIVEAQKDLRDADIRFNAIQNDNVKEIGVIRATHQKEIGDLRAAHAEQLRISDLTMLEKTRSVDVLAGAQSAAQLATAVQTLASISSRDAETLRTQLTATAQAMAKQTADAAAATAAQTDSLMKDVNNRIAELQKSSYQGAGKQSVSDPQMEKLTEVVAMLAKTQATGTGEKSGISSAWATVIVVIGVIGILFGIVVGFNTMNKAPAAYSQPTKP